MTISHKLLLENEVYGCSPGTPTTSGFKTITQCREFVSLGHVYSMRIYPGKLQKRINIYPYYFDPFRRNTEK